MKSQTLEEIKCPRFENCNATMCPLAPNLEHLIWYPDEELCGAKKFQTLHWIKKQKAIIKAKAPTDKFFTVNMLKSLRQARKGIEGLDPDLTIEKGKVAEGVWIGKLSQRVIANKISKSVPVVANKKGKNIKTGKETPNKNKGKKKGV